MRLLYALFLCTASSVVAEASYISILDRCTEQNLVPAEAEMRIAWFLACRKQPPELVELVEFYAQRKPVSYPLVYSPSANSWKGPLRKDAPCGDWVIKSFCIASCYTPDQEILFESGFLPIEEALNHNETHLIVLAPNSTLQKPVFKTISVEAYARSWQESHEIIRVIQTRSGGELKVTENHPVLLGSGDMIEARDLQIGDFLIKQNGQLDPVVAIQNVDYFGKVYNISPQSLDPYENILVAQGFLMGSGAYQYTEELHARIRTPNR